MRLIAGVALLSALLLITESRAVTYQLAHTFRDSQPSAGDLFGTAVAIEGGVVAIKSRSGNQDGDTLSRTHVFEANASGGFDEVATFDFDFADASTPAGSLVGNFFKGDEVDIDGGVIAVSYGQDSRAVSREPVQILERDATGTWQRQFASLAPETPNLTEGLVREAGRTVDISGDTFIVEALTAVRPGSDPPVVAGGARIFERQPDNTWVETATLFAPPEDFEFGIAYSAALDGDTAVISYRESSVNGNPSRDYFFERDAEGLWSLAAFFAPASELVEDIRFPLVEIDEDLAFVRDLDIGIYAAYERIEGVWQEATSSLVFDDGFLSSEGFAIEGDRLARTIGGVIEVYQRNTTGEFDLLTTIENPLPPEEGLQFGARLAFDDGRLLVGARSTFALDPVTSPGAAFLFVPVPDPRRRCSRFSA